MRRVTCCPDQLRYGNRLGVTPNIDGMAAIVQSLVPASCSGVLHTAQTTATYSFQTWYTNMNAVGIKFITATSLNQGQSEICDLSEAKAFSEEAKVPYLLHDPLLVGPHVKGSFPVVDLEKGVAIREGMFLSNWSRRSSVWSLTRPI